MKRMRHIRYVLKDTHPSLFINRPEKGTAEWNIFRAIRRDLAIRGSFLIAIPGAHRR